MRARRGAVLTAPFALGDEGPAARALRGAALDAVGAELRAGTMAFPTLDAFVETEVKGSPLEALLDDASYRGLLEEAREQLQPFRACGGRGHADGRVVLTAQKA